MWLSLNGLMAFLRQTQTNAMGLIQPSHQILLLRNPVLLLPCSAGSSHPFSKSKMCFFTCTKVAEDPVSVPAEGSTFHKYNSIVLLGSPPYTLWPGAPAQPLASSLRYGMSCYALTHCWGDLREKKRERKALLVLCRGKLVLQSGPICLCPPPQRIVFSPGPLGRSLSIRCCILSEQRCVPPEWMWRLGTLNILPDR